MVFVVRNRQLASKSPKLRPRQSVQGPTSLLSARHLAIFEYHPIAIDLVGLGEVRDTCALARDAQRHHGGVHLKVGTE